MSRLLLRQTHTATLTPEQAEELVCANGCGRVVHRDGNNLLVELDAPLLEALKAQLDGWVVAEQGPRIPVPDAHLKLRS